MFYYGEEATPEVSGETWVEEAVSSEPPPPKAPCAYWQDLKLENATETGKGKDSKRSHSKGSDSKGKDAKGKDAKGKDAKKKGCKREGFQMRKEIADGRRRYRSSREYLFFADRKRAELGAGEMP